MGLFQLMMILALLLAGCGETPTPTLAPPTATAVPPTATPVPPTAEPAEEPTPVSEATPPAEPAGQPLYLAIIWHQHQPLYFKDPATGVYQKPWVRVHAAKDYVDMATILEDYPDIKATYNLTPSLIHQLDDLAAGAEDLYWVHSEIPA